MKLRLVLSALGLAAAAAIAWLWLAGAPTAPVAGGGAPVRTAPGTAGPPPVAALAPRVAPAAPAPEAAEAPPAEPEAERGDDHPGHGGSVGSANDLAVYAERPMSRVPHQVVRGWGARGAGKIPGVVGAYVVVDPGIADGELVKLASDIRAYHADAAVLSVRILDSETAATYDRHSDGGELAAAHLVGLVNRNERLGMDRIEVRGRTVAPADADAP